MATKRCQRDVEKQKEAELKCNKLKATLKDCLHSLNKETAKFLQANARASALVDEVSNLENLKVWYENQTNQLRQELEKANLTAVENAAKNAANRIKIEECDANIELQTHIKGEVQKTLEEAQKTTNKKNELLRAQVEELTKAAQLSPRYDTGKQQYYIAIRNAMVSLLPKTVRLEKFPSQDDLPQRIAQVILQRTNLENEFKNKTLTHSFLIEKIRREVSKEGGVNAWFGIVPDPYIDQALSWPARVAMI